MVYTNVNKDMLVSFMPYIQRKSSLESAYRISIFEDLNAPVHIFILQAPILKDFNESEFDS